jgi:hypothetical protein
MRPNHAIINNSGDRSTAKATSRAPLMSYPPRVLPQFRPIEDPAPPALVGNPEETFMQSRYRGWWQRRQHKVRTNLWPSSPILLNDFPFLPGDQNTSPIERYPPVFANPFGDHNYADSRPRSSGMVGAEPLHSETAHRMHSPASSLIPVARSDEEHDIVTADPAVSKTYSFVSLPGNAVKKRPRRRYDEIERLYHCSWLGCTKSYGTLNHLNAHIVMQRHGSKRTPAGEIHSLCHD